MRCWVIGTGKWPAAARNSGRAEGRMKEEAYLDLIPVDCNPTDRQPEPSGSVTSGGGGRVGIGSWIERREKLLVDSPHRLAWLEETSFLAAAERDNLSSYDVLVDPLDCLGKH